MSPPRDNGWIEYEHLVLHELEKHGEMLAKLNEDITGIRAHDLTALHVELAKIKTELSIKAGIWGAIAGLIPVVITLLIKHL